MHNDNKQLTIHEMADAFQGDTLPVIFMADDGPRQIGTIWRDDFDQWGQETLTRKIDAIMATKGLAAFAISRIRTYAGRPAVICHA